jgi:putative ABC transport system permease protein
MSAPQRFRRLLRLLPFDFRADYGREMEQVFREQHRDAAGAAARAGVWARTIRDLVAIGPREHLIQLRQDARYALRGLRRAPGFVAVVLATLALGIGLNTAIFSVVYAVLLQPLPYSDPERLASVANRWSGSPEARLSDPEYLDYSEQTRTMTMAAAATSPVNLTGDATDAERVLAAGVTPGFFDVVGVHPVLGRGFDAGDGVAGRDRVVVLTDRLWRRRYNADPSLVGRTIVVSGSRYEVIGVMPATFRMPSDFGAEQQVALLVPQVFDAAAPRNKRGGHYLSAYGRLRSDVTGQQAQAEMTAIVEQLVRQYPDEHNQGNFGVRVDSLRTQLVGPAEPVVFTLVGAVALVLLIACANVANLMLARGEARRREMAVRVALGASRFRIVRQLLTESLMLALGGAVLGLGVAFGCQRLVTTVDPATLPRVADLQLNGAVLAFTLVLAAATATLCGLIPAVQLLRAGRAEAIDAGSRGSVDTLRSRTRRVLIVAQVAVAVVLVTAAGLLIRTFVTLVRVPSGLEPDHVLTLRLSPPPAAYPSQRDIGTFFDTYLDRLRALPGVRAAGAASGLPLASASGDWSFDIDGRPFAPGRRHSGAADWYAVTPGYFESLRVRLVKGRLPSSADSAGSSDPAIFLNEAAARQFFPDGAAIGHRMKLSGRDQPWRTIAGVVGDVHHRGLSAPVQAEMFVPLAQFKHFSDAGQARALSVVVRTEQDPNAAVGAVRAALRGLDPDVPPAQIRDMPSVVAASVADRRLYMILMSAFGGLALGLAAIGVYGVMAYQVVKRTREMGVRLALGATPGSVRGLVIADGMRLVVIGLVCGVVAAAAGGGLVRHLLFGVDPHDLATFAGSAAAIGVAGLLACVVPAVRATRVDPSVALRIDA